MRPALLTFAAVLAGLTVLVFALDGETGIGDELLNVLAAAAAGVAVFYGRTEPEGGLRRAGLAVAAAAIAVIVAIVAVRAAV
ncbi:MAG: hypothetical protein ACR2NB_14825 [Solirubrobacteraceae bacterium]